MIACGLYGSLSRSFVIIRMLIIEYVILYVHGEELMSLGKRRKQLIQEKWGYTKYINIFIIMAAYIITYVP